MPQSLLDLPAFTGPPVLKAVPARPPLASDDGEAKSRLPLIEAEHASLPYGDSRNHLGDVTTDSSVQWRQVIGCPAVTPIEQWWDAMVSFIFHPERNSSNILRADILCDLKDDDRVGSAASEDATAPSDKSRSTPAPDDGASSLRWKRKRRIVRRILPRKPGINSHLDQLCTLWESSSKSLSQAADQGLVVYTPLVLVETDGGNRVGSDIDAKGWNGVVDHESLDTVLQTRCRSVAGPGEMPFYHPSLLALAFTYHLGDDFSFRRHPAADERSEASADGVRMPRFGAPRLALSVIPFPSATGKDTTVPESLRRICSTLLSTLHRHTWGRLHEYVARVEHDRLVPRSMFQDVYLNLKHRWAGHIVRNWQEVTSPDKHVHEDLGVAAWLICFWRQRFGRPLPAEAQESIGLADRPWLKDALVWGRPAGGFVDVGCGNGLLVWLLTNEGYMGHGFDLRPRKSWKSFQQDVTRVEVSYPDYKASKTGGHIANGSAHAGDKTDIGTPTNGRTMAVDVMPANLRVHTLDALEAICAKLDPEVAREKACEGDVDDTSTVTMSTMALEDMASLFPRGSFLIGNHADELTPLLPLLATVVVEDCAGLANIPCCPWTVSGERFGRSLYRVSREEVAELLMLMEPSREHSVEAETTPEARTREGATMLTSPAALAQVAAEMLELGLGPAVDPGPSPAPAPARTTPPSTTAATTKPVSNTSVTQSRGTGPQAAEKGSLGGGSKSRNVAYLAYISHLHLIAGWHVEKEALRIPSTRNWAVVSTRRVGAAFAGDHNESRTDSGEEEIRRRILALVGGARHSWKARDAAGEGKWFLQPSADDHASANKLGGH